MNPLNSPPPIPTPDGQNYAPPSRLVVSGDWQSAPGVVKGWAYPLTWLGIVIWALFLLVPFFAPSMSAVEKVGSFLLYGAFLALNIWLNQALKKGLQAAWTVQMVVSCLGLLGFPVGTIIHGYILSQWSKPETKAWFGKS